MPSVFGCRLRRWSRHNRKEVGCEKHLKSTNKRLLTLCSLNFQCIFLFPKEGVPSHLPFPEVIHQLMGRDLLSTDLTKNGGHQSRPQYWLGPLCGAHSSYQATAPSCSCPRLRHSLHHSSEALSSASLHFCSFPCGVCLRSVCCLHSCFLSCPGFACRRRCGRLSSKRSMAAVPEGGWLTRLMIARLCRRNYTSASTAEWNGAVRLGRGVTVTGHGRVTQKNDSGFPLT